MKAAIVLTVIILGMVAACSPIRYQSSTKIKDSLVIRHSTVYDTVEVKKSVVSIERETMDTSSFVMDVKQGQAEIKTVQKNGKFKSTCICDSLAIVKKLKTPDTVHYISKVTENTGLKYVPVTSKFDHFCEWWFFITCGILVAGLAIKVYKFFV